MHARWRQAVKSGAKKERVTDLTDWLEMSEIYYDSSQVDYRNAVRAHQLLTTVKTPLISTEQLHRLECEVQRSADDYLTGDEEDAWTDVEDEETPADRERRSIREQNRILLK